MKKILVVLCCVFVMLSLIACSAVKKESSLNTNLEFWITENVTDFDFSDYTIKPGDLAGTQYYGKKYKPVKGANNELLDPKKCVVYTVTNYPDYESEKLCITHIFITDDNIRFYDISLKSSVDEFKHLIEEHGYKVTDYTEEYCQAEKDDIAITFTNDCIDIRVQVTNKNEILF